MPNEWTILMTTNNNLIIDNKSDRQINSELIFSAYTSIMHGENVDKKNIVNLIITDDLEIESLNFKYRGLKRVTDVLSFSDDCKVSSMLGDIIIDIYQAERQKKDSLDSELQVLFIHGLLHLLGYDHLSTKDYNAMHLKEEYYNKILRSKNQSGG